MRQATNLYPMNGGAPGPGLRLPSPARLPATSGKFPVAAGHHAVPGATLFPARQRPLVGTVSKSIVLATPPQVELEWEKCMQNAELAHNNWWLTRTITLDLVI